MLDARTGRGAFLAVADDLNEALGIGIRQRSQQHGVDDRGDGTGRADADSERQDRSDGEGTLPEEGANRDAEIGSQARQARIARLARCGVCLAQWPHGRRQCLRVEELADRRAEGLVRGRALGQEFVIALVEMLRELVDDLGLPRRIET